jgi:hypothetical protein
VESSFLYVELISADGRLITRLKVLGEQGRFANTMPLSTKLDAGRYTLRAYTKWMSNFDKEYLFSKELVIGNYIDDSIQTQITYTTNKDESVTAKIHFTDDIGQNIVDNYVEYTLNLRGKSKVFATKTDDNGYISFRFRPSNYVGDCLRLKITANSRVLERTLQLPSFSDNFSVQFMPEGGNLIAGFAQVVAFKAIGTDGKSVEIEGYISDKSENRVCDIKSQNKGMGSFILTAQAGEQYTATITSAVKTPATCGVKGTTTYTAKFAETWAETKTKDVEDIAALEHTWSVSYDFAEDGKSCTARCEGRRESCEG